MDEDQLAALRQHYDNNSTADQMEGGTWETTPARRPRLVQAAMDALARMRMALGEEALDEDVLERHARTFVLALYAEGWSLHELVEIEPDVPAEEL